MTVNQLDALAAVITYLHIRVMEINDYQEVINEYKRVREELSALNEEQK